MANITFNGYTPPVRNKKSTYTITLSLFFDGTKNNKNNSNARSSNNNQHWSYKTYGEKDTESSYQNDWSNVARIWQNYKVAEEKIYIEGIGTTDYKEDTMTGYAFGSGFTGIRFKVRKGCEEAANKIKTKINSNKDKTLSKIIFNVYGFSRGAAAARNFVYEIGKAAYNGRLFEFEGLAIYYDSDDMPAINKLPAGGHLGYALLQRGITLETNKVVVNFLGIFDTVSSYSTSLLPSFLNDIKELNLNSIGRARHVVHFTAIDEMRENFSLTRCPKGIEKNLPGVHSDIGGSYLSGKEIIEEIETSWTLKSILEKLKSSLVQEGWYKPNELTITGGNIYWALRGEKQIVYKEYSYIPLHFMAKYSTDYDALIDLSLVLIRYSIEQHEVLKRVKQDLERYVMDHEEYPYSDNGMTNSRLVDLKKLRYSYFHRSARREGIGMDPNNNWKRKVLKP